MHAGVVAEALERQQRRQRQRQQHHQREQRQRRGAQRIGQWRGLFMRCRPRSRSTRATSSDQVSCTVACSGQRWAAVVGAAHLQVAQRRAHAVQPLAAEEEAFFDAHR
jgi:hypothetical protein